jgi:hypothetical protein
VKQVSRFQSGCRREWRRFNFALQPDERFIFCGQPSNSMSNMTCRQENNHSRSLRDEQDSWYVSEFFVEAMSHSAYTSTSTFSQLRKHDKHRWLKRGKPIDNRSGSKRGRLYGRELPRFENSRNVEISDHSNRVEA